MAIQLLKKCQEENRFATPDEQIILSKYVGWGGIPEAFDENNSAWGTEYLEMKTVLTPEETVYDASASGHNIVGWSPYNGIRLPYRVAATYLRGQPVFDGKNVVAEPGTGAALSELVQADLQRYGALIRSQGIQLDDTAR